MEFLRNPRAIIEELKALKKALSEIQKNSESNNNSARTCSGTQNNVTGNQHNIQININAHGEENVAYLTHEFLTKCITDAKQDGLPNLIKTIHMNQDHPENQNIRGKSLRQNTLETYDGTRWNLKPANGVLDNLIQRGCRVFNTHLMRNLQHPDFQSEDLQNILQETLTELTDITTKRRSETYYRIRRNMFFMFFNDNPDELVLVLEPEGQDIVESVINAENENESD
jgi:hypothetical protein